MKPKHIAIEFGKKSLSPLQERVLVMIFKSLGT